MRRLITPIILAAALLGALLAGFVYSWGALNWGPESDFLQNLLAGGVGILIDVVLVALIVTRITDVRETSQWRYARQRLVEAILNDVALVIFYVHQRMYTIIVGSDLVRYLPKDVRTLLDNNFSTTDDSEIQEILPRLQLVIDLQSVAINAELATFTGGLMAKVEVLSKPTHWAAYSPLGSSTAITCADKDTFRSSVLEPLEWLLRQSEELRDFVSKQLRGPLRDLIYSSPDFHDRYLLKSNMLCSLLKDVRAEVDQLEEGAKAQCHHFRSICAPLFERKVETAQQTDATDRPSADR